MKASHYSRYWLQGFIFTWIAVTNNAFEIYKLTRFRPSKIRLHCRLCLWRRSLCSNLRGIDPEKLYRATLSREPRVLFNVSSHIACPAQPWHSAKFKFDYLLEHLCPNCRFLIVECGAKSVRCFPCSHLLAPSLWSVRLKQAKQCHGNEKIFFSPNWSNSTLRICLFQHTLGLLSAHGSKSALGNY